MSKRKYTIDNIKYFLEGYGFDWCGKTIFDSQQNKYRDFRCEDYRKDVVVLYLKNNLGAYFNAICRISEIEFVIKIGSQKMNLSLNWQEYLNQLNSKVTP